MILKDVKPGKKLYLNPRGELSAFEEEERQTDYKERDEGEKRGYAKAIEESKQFIALLHTIANRLMEQKKQLLTQLRPEVIDFSLSIAEKIIRKELSDPKMHEKLIHSLLNQAMKAYAGESLKVYLAPDDLVLFHERFPLEGGTISYVADPLLQQGDCRIVAKSGLLSAQVTRELEDLRAKLSCQ